MKYLVAMCFSGLIAMFMTDLALGQTQVPNTFQQGQPARAAEVNDNFSSLASAIDDVSADNLTTASDVAINASTVQSNAADIQNNTDSIATNAADFASLSLRVDALELNTLDAEIQTALDNGRRGMSSGDGALRTLDQLINTLGLTCAETNYGRFHGCTQITAGDGTVHAISQKMLELSIARVVLPNIPPQQGMLTPTVMIAQTNSGNPGDMIVAGSANLFRWTYRESDDVGRLVDDCDNPTIAMSPVALEGTSSRWRVNNGGYYYAPVNETTGTFDAISQIDVTGQMVGIVKNIHPFGVFDVSTIEWCVMSDQVTGLYNSYELRPYPFNLNDSQFSLPLTAQ